MKNLNIILLSLIAVFIFSRCDFIDSIIDDNPPTQSHKVGDTLWIHTVPNLDKTTYLNNIPFAIGNDGSLYYVASGDQVTWAPSRLYAINKEDGTLKWKTEPLAIWHVNSNIVVADDGTIYILSYYFLYSINPQTGAFNWVWEVPKTLIIDGEERYTYGEVGALALCNNGDLVFKTTGSGSYSRAMYCVDKNQNTRWYRPIPSSGTPISVGNTGIIYDYEYFENVKHIIAINPSNGNVLWKKKLEFSGCGSNNIAVTTNGDLICSVFPDSLYSISPSGKTNWKIQDKHYQCSKLISPTEIVYTYNQWSGMSRFDVNTGVAVGNNISVPDETVLDSKGNFYKAGGDGIIEFDTEGIRKDTFSFHVGAHGKNIALSKDNILYSGGPDKKIIAIQIENPIATKGWPCFTHDNRNTFNYSKRNN